MRLLFVLENYYPHIGGVETVFQHLCEGLAHKGHTVKVLTRRIPGARDRERLHGVDIERISSFDNRYVFTLTALPRALALAAEADIVHTTTYNAAFPAWFAARLHRKSAIITVHENWLGHWRVYTNFSPLRAWIHEVLERLVYLPRFDRYVCVSRSTQRQLLNAIPRLQPRTSTIYNGFDETPWSTPHSKEVSALRKKLGLAQKFVIFYSGRPGTTKGVEYLIEAYSQIQLPDAVLVLMLSKDAQYRDKVEEYKKKHPNILFLDPVPRASLIVHRQMADCNMIPSVSEGFGYAVLESAATGKPFIASDTTSIPEVVGGKYLLVPPRDAHSIAQAITKIHAGIYKKTNLKKFPWSTTIAAYEKLYETI